MASAGSAATARLTGEPAAPNARIRSAISAADRDRHAEVLRLGPRACRLDDDACRPPDRRRVPTDLHARRHDRPRRGGKSVMSLRASTYQLQMSAWRAASPSILGPFAPTMIGIRPGRGPRAAARGPGPSGSPLEVRLAGPEERDGISTASANRPRTWSSGRPKAWASRPAWPEPRPNTGLPPPTSSSVSTALAVIPGFRWSADRIHVPTFIRDVAAATAPVIATNSHQPWTAIDGAP